MKGKRLALEEFSGDADLAQRQEQIDGDARNRRVVLDRIVVVRVQGSAQVALKMRAAHDQRCAYFSNFDERAADVCCLAGETLDDQRFGLRARDSWLGVNRARRGDGGRGDRR